MSCSFNSNTALRRNIRNRRRALPASIQKRHGQQAARHFFRSYRLLSKQRIAVYLDNDGELSTQPLIQRLARLGKSLYLPVLHPHNKGTMWFCPYHPNDKLIKNRFDIAEPNHRQRKPVRAWAIDIVITPLVCFDHKGNRMGMGGGFYDRTFHFKRRASRNRLPWLIGYAHELQQQATLSTQPWDIPLNAVITESRLKFFD